MVLDAHHLNHDNDKKTLKQGIKKEKPYWRCDKTPYDMI